jgi:hypothetical protein
MSDKHAIADEFQQAASSDRNNSQHTPINFARGSQFVVAFAQHPDWRVHAFERFLASCEAA